jgi:hypothetical protein
MQQSILSDSARVTPSRSDYWEGVDLESRPIGGRVKNPQTHELSSKRTVSSKRIVAVFLLSMLAAAVGYVVYERGWAATRHLVVESVRSTVRVVGGTSVVHNLTVDPRTIARRVEFDLWVTRAFDLSQIQIRTAGNTVTLDGSVRSLAEKLLAERIARESDGVQKVVNNLGLPAGTSQ